MVVVSNTSPILNLAIINRLNLLREQFRKIYIPLAVITELRVAENLPGSEQVRAGIHKGWLRVEKIKKLSTINIIKRDLDIGEAEAIALALELKADWILLDEREARKTAKNLGLSVTGVLGILLKARRQGKVTSFSDEVAELRKKAGFHIKEKFLKTLLEECGETLKDPNSIRS